VIAKTNGNDNILVGLQAAERGAITSLNVSESLDNVIDA